MVSVVKAGKLTLTAEREGVAMESDGVVTLGRNTAERPKAVVIGGSIAGLSCAHALLRIGWSVTVLEKSTLPPQRCSTGAGIGLDYQAFQILSTWTDEYQSSPLLSTTLPLSIDMVAAVVDDGGKKVRKVLAEDEEFGFRAAHWYDLHNLLWKCLKNGDDVVRWGHQFVEFGSDQGKQMVTVRAREVSGDEIVEFSAELVVAADGCLSTVRKTFLPHHELRYSGYCAWRGVLDFSNSESSETISNLRAAYPELGKCLYFDIVTEAHSVLYELFKNRINWLWYVNQPEPEIAGNSVTMKVSDDMIKNMQMEAKRVWIPAIAELMEETKDPFINAIYDSDPLPKLVWGNVVLVGDAAHPTTPHGLRSTNMSIVDAEVLAKCLEKWGLVGLGSALEEFESIRLPVVSQQVLHSRHLGLLKQGLADIGNEGCDCLLQKNMPFFKHAAVFV